MEGPEANNDTVKLVDGGKSTHDSDPMGCRKIAIYCLWGVAQIFLLCYCISSLSLISIDNTVAAVDFAIVLLMIVGIILFVGGTCFLVRFMSPLKLGIVIGTSLILANQMFVLSIITGQDLATRDTQKKIHPEESAVAFLGAWCCLSYLIVAAIFWYCREYLAPLKQNFTNIQTDDSDDAKYDTEMNI